MTWRFGASTGVCLERPIVEVLDAVHRAGIEGVELGTPPRHFDPWQLEQVRAVERRLVASGVQPVSIHAPFGGLLDLSDPNPHHRHAAVGAILGAAAALRDLGGGLVVVHTTDVPRQGQDVDERLHWCAQAMEVLSRACHHLGMQLAIESPLPHLIGGHPDEFAWILARVDRRAGVCLDTSHTTLGHHWERFVELAGDRLVHVHANDHHGRFDDHLPPGDGTIDWPVIVRSLEAVRYRGWIILELRCPDEPLDAYFRRAIDQAHARIAVGAPTVQP